MLDTKAYNEVNAIIKIMPREMQEKIPENLRKTIEFNQDKNYKFNIDETNIEDIEFLEDTEKILSVLYTDYFASEEERKIILNKEKALELKKEQEKKQKYSNNFSQKNIKEYKAQNTYLKEKNLPVEVNNETILIKIKQLLKNLFNK